MSFNKKAVSLGITVVLIGAVVAAGIAGGRIGLKNDAQEAELQVADSAANEVAVNELPVNVIDDKYRTTYEVFVYSFSDSDGDGVGDIQGLIDKLDYIGDGDPETDTDLGCNEIWLMPISPSPTYHKYDVTDYKDIDPEYGTMEDFDELIKACHDRGIRVIIDQVYNHSSVEHPWFKDAAEFLKDHPGITFENGNYSASFYIDCPKLSYYNFANEQLAGYEPLPGTEYFYEARFWSGMPDLNLDSDAVRREIADITGFWLEHGVDGFRLDAVTYYYTGNDSANIDFMTWLNDTVKSVNPDAYIVAESWTNSST
jgi:glycosidase